MVRSMNQRLHCPECDTLHTAETAFERWMRNERLLDSALGIVRFDLDVLLHRYKFNTDVFGDRTIQAMMFIEVKTLAAEPSAAQSDTLHLLNQVLRNRRGNKYRKKRGAHADNRTPMAEAFSLARNDKVRLWLYGGHCLRLESNSPETSRWIKWDKKDIDSQQLIQLLSFEIDPDSLNPIDWRRRTYTQKSMIVD